MDVIKADVILYTPHLLEFGGIEQFCQDWCAMLRPHYNVIFVTSSSANTKQLEIIRQFCDVKYDNNKFECKYLLLNNIFRENRLDCKVKYKCYGMVHTDYERVSKEFDVEIYNKDMIDEYIAVSKSIGDAFYRKYKIKCKTIYNILRNYKPKLVFMSATRLSKEKGLPRMIQFVEECNKRGYEDMYEYQVYTNRETYGIDKKLDEYFIFKEPKLDLSLEYKQATYVVQLSDYEGFSYTIRIAHKLGTPTITTDFPSIYEGGINGYVLPFDLFENGSEEDWDKVIHDIFNNIPVVNYQEMCTVDDWKGVFPNIRKTNKKYVYNNGKVLVRCIVNVKEHGDTYFRDQETGIKRFFGHEWEVTRTRADELLGKGLVEEVE